MRPCERNDSLMDSCLVPPHDFSRPDAWQCSPAIPSLVSNEAENSFADTTTRNPKEIMVIIFSLRSYAARGNTCGGTAAAFQEFMIETRFSWFHNVIKTLEAAALLQCSPFRGISVQLYKDVSDGKTSTSYAKYLDFLYKTNSRFKSTQCAHNRVSVIFSKGYWEVAIVRPTSVLSLLHITSCHYRILLGQQDMSILPK